MKIQIFIISFILLILSSCETRDLDAIRDKNTNYSFSYHLAIKEAIKEDNSDLNQMVKDLHYLMKGFYKEHQCLQLDVKLYLKNGYQTPLELQYGEFNLEEFTITHKDSINQNAIDLKVFHGLIYEKRKSLFKKGSQVRGLITDLKDPKIDRVETLSFMEYERNE